LWKFQTGGKIYSTPAIKGNKVICPSTDGTIYCLNIENGNQFWTYETGNAIVASPVIRRNKVYVGSSEGIFRAVSLQTGVLIWKYDSIRNFVETKPLLYRRKVFFGSWGNTFYALDQKTGKLLWKREKYTNRMLSPAAVWPVAARNKIFIVAPDRHMTAFDAANGKEIWDSGKHSCRESIGLSGNKKLVYIKNMTEGNVDAFYTNADTQQLAWESKADLGYEIAPTSIVGQGNLIFIPTASGIICAIDRTKHLVIWKYKLSNSLITGILPVTYHKILVTSMDGKVACLDY